MHTRFMLIVALAASAAAPLGAEPAKVPAESASQPESRPAEVLLASAEVRSPQSDSQTPQADTQPPQAAAPAAVPAKRPRAARVTSCRCAGQLPQQP